MNKNKILFGASLLSWPLVSSAILSTTRNFFAQSLDIIRNIIIPLTFALAMLFFFWGIAQYIRSTGTDKENAKTTMTWGVIAIFVMASVWGLVRFIQDEFDIDQVPSQPIPSFTNN
jgi:hypothetical protein